jgi:predicted metalloprotease
MKWQGRRASRNIIDRRGSANGRRVGRSGAAQGIGGLGLVAVLVIGYFLGVDVRPLLDGAGANSSRIENAAPASAAEQQAGQFVAVVLADTEEIWTDVFRAQLNASYRAPQLVLFSGATYSACGGAEGASGPFYCPPDRMAYLDTQFFDVLRRRLGASGDFAAAYVVAHEVAHHVQNETGILPWANEQRAGASDAESNRISVMIELQADCFSGIWAHFAEANLGVIERGDLAEALNAARQIGDDTLQRNAGRRPNPHTFTHGTSEQRARWFQRGYDTGQMRQCDTFNASRL